MTPDDAFLQAIFDDVDDDTPRLVYADWLEEHGEPERAEFIHVQCALADLAEDDPRRPPLEQREHQLLSLHEKTWRSQLPSLPGITWGRFERGLVDEVRVVRLNTFLHRAEALFAAAPVRSVRFLSVQNKVRQLAESPHLARLSSLDLRNNALGSDGVRILTGSAHLGNLTTLNLSYTRPGSEGLSALAVARLAQLTALDLSGNGLAARDMVSLVGAGWMKQLRRLWLTQNHLDDEGVRTLVASPALAGLKVLELSRNDIGPAGAQALIGSPHLGNLTRLSLYGHHFRPEVCVALRARFGNRVCLP